MSDVVLLSWPFEDWWVGLGYCLCFPGEVAVACCGYISDRSEPVEDEKKSRNIFHWGLFSIKFPRAGSSAIRKPPTRCCGADHPPSNRIPTSMQFLRRCVSHVGVTQLMLMFGLLVARKLVLWSYSSCVVCKDVWRRKPAMEDDDIVLETNWIYPARLMTTIGIQRAKLTTSTWQIQQNATVATTM